MNAQLNEALRGRLAKDGAPLDEVLTKSFSVERPLKFEELGGFDMIAEAITSVCGDTPDKSKMGQVMGALMKAHRGEFDGKVANGWVKDMLS